MSDAAPLYRNPRLYDRVFPVDGEEVDFFAGLIDSCSPNTMVVDLGSGTGRFTGLLEIALGRPMVGIDREVAMVRGAKDICGCLMRLPFSNRSVGAFTSRLFGVAYAMAGNWETSGAGYTQALEEIIRCLVPGGIAALEVPIAHLPHRLMGVEESARLEPDLVYSFRYLDVLRRTEIGAILDTRIDVQLAGEKSHIHAPIHVFIPHQLSQWLTDHGCKLIGYCAPYDMATLTDVPPEESLRGVVVFQMPGATVAASSTQTSH